MFSLNSARATPEALNTRFVVVEVDMVPGFRFADEDLKKVISVLIKLIEFESDIIVWLVISPLDSASARERVTKG